MFGLSLAEVKKTGDCPWCNFRKSYDTLLTLISRFCSRAWWILLFTPVNFSISSWAQTLRIFSVDRGGDDPGVHGGDHLQQAGAPQEARVHPDVQQERRCLPARWHQLFAIQVRQL